MAPTDPLDRLEAWHQDRDDQPFGNVDAVTGQTLQPFSRAGADAARNLLAKAERAVANDDLGSARGFVSRSVALPYDEHEGVHPAAMASHMAVFVLLTDALEESDAGDDRWLVAASELWPALDDEGRFTLRDSLTAIAQEYEVSRGERRLIASLVADVPARAELIDLVDLSPQELTERVLSVVVLAHRYRAALQG